jgi:hypothetical protein
MPLSRSPARCLLLFSLLLTPAWGAPFDVIVCGKGGDAEFDGKFQQWGGRLRDVLTADLLHPPDNVFLLLKPRAAPADAPTTGGTDLEAVEAVFATVAGRCTNDDELFVYLIGHGSHQQGVSKLNLAGPDLSAEDLKAMIDKVACRRAIIVNGASTSAGFINVLSGEGRIVCTATRSVEERNATDFMEFFVQGLEDAGADQNRDERISVLEAVQQAASLTEAGYVGRGLISTEHALLDDNGDGLGTRLPLGTADRERRDRRREEPAVAEGLRAATCYIKEFHFPTSVPPDLARAYLDALEAVERLKLEKSKLEAADYYPRLETLLIKAAMLNREIHAIENARTEVPSR